MFSNRDLKKLIVPLFMEQLLVMLVGIADMFVAGFVGEEAVSGVSLVNSFNTIFIYIFMALASGGAVVISQYIGHNEPDSAGRSASQLLIVSVIFSVFTSVIVFVWNRNLMYLIFGRVEPSVMDACVTYLRISAYSYPAIAVYNAGAALYRSFGKTSTTMYISALSNIINIAGNFAGVLLLKAGVYGVAVPSLISRVFSAVVITFLCFSGKNPVRYRKRWIFMWDRGLIRRILGIAVPNGIENGISQFVKVVLSGVVALFGTHQIAANGIAQSIYQLSAIACTAMGPVFITVTGRCMGAGDIPAAEFYFRKLLKINILFSVLWNFLITALVPFFLHFYAVAEETKHFVIMLVVLHNAVNAVVYPVTDPFGKGLRAAGDVKYTMVVSIISSVFCRLLFSVLFGVTLDMGVMGIAYAMCLDWILRAVIFWTRFKSGKWKEFQVI